MQLPDTIAPDARNRECAICGHKRHGADADNCTACIERVEIMWRRNGVLNDRNPPPGRSPAL